MEFNYSEITFGNITDNERYYEFELDGDKQICKMKLKNEE